MKDNQPQSFFRLKWHFHLEKGNCARMNVKNLLIRTTVIFLMLFSTNSSAVFTRINKDKYLFLYKNDGSSFERKVTITGCTFLENVSEYAQNAVLQSNELTVNDQELNIEISHVRAIRIHRASQPIYNNLIAFLIRSTDGQLFIHVRIAVDMVAPNRRFLPVLLQYSRRVITTSLATETRVGSAMVMDLDVADYLQTVAAASGTEARTYYAWTTIQIDETMLKESEQSIMLSGLFSFSYEVVEESDYGSMRLTNGSR